MGSWAIVEADAVVVDWLEAVVLLEASPPRTGGGGDLWTLILTVEVYRWQSRDSQGGIYVVLNLVFQRVGDSASSGSFGRVEAVRPGFGVRRV